MLEHAALGARLAAVQHFLARHEALWKARPFTERHLTWEDTYPALATWLRQRSLADAEEAATLAADHLAPSPMPSLAAEAAALVTLETMPCIALAPAPARLDRDVPGRKWQQIEAFARHLGFAAQTHNWVDWCGGKGHLGRRLVQAGQQVTCLEFDPALIHAGQALSDRHHLRVRHCQQDVLDHTVALQPSDTPVALHACGDLHVRLLHLATARGCTQLAIAPCCYNRTQATHYVPLSKAAKAQPLALSREDLGLPANEAVTAGARERRQRDVSMARRLGFDLLQRQVRGQDVYLPTPSLPASWLSASFADYCLHLARLKGIALSPNEDWAAWEAQGWARLAQVRNLERVRNLFRRPLELWLVLDRAVFLQEQGYKVRVGTFCEPRLTPRNLLIVAERSLARCG